MRKRFGDLLELIRFRERGWDKHQDVWSYRKASRSYGDAVL